MTPNTVLDSELTAHASYRCWYGKNQHAVNSMLFGGACSDTPKTLDYVLEHHDREHHVITWYKEPLTCALIQFLLC